LFSGQSLSRPPSRAPCCATWPSLDLPKKNKGLRNLFRTPRLRPEGTATPASNGPGHDHVDGAFPRAADVPARVRCARCAAAVPDFDAVHDHHCAGVRPTELCIRLARACPALVTSIHPYKRDRRIERRRPKVAAGELSPVTQRLGKAGPAWVNSFFRVVRMRRSPAGGPPVNDAARSPSLDGHHPRTSGGAPARCGSASLAWNPALFPSPQAPRRAHAPPRRPGSSRFASADSPFKRACDAAARPLREVSRPSGRRLSAEPGGQAPTPGGPTDRFVGLSLAIRDRSSFVKQASAYNLGAAPSLIASA